MAMRAVVVYESMYGNSRLVADAIGAGLRPAFEVTVVPVAKADPAVLTGADLVVVGGPTHIHGMSREATRKSAVQAASLPGSELTAEPDALGSGVREWLTALGRFPVSAAAFDTRLDGPAAFTGRASKKVARSLSAHGFEVAIKPESFLVTKQNQLVAGEEDRARAWGARLATATGPKRKADARHGVRGGGG